VSCDDENEKGWIGVLIGLLLVLTDFATALETPAAKEGRTAPIETAKQTQPESPSLFDMSLEQLMDIPVTSTSLTTVSSGRVIPSTVTTITQQDIIG